MLLVLAICWNSNIITHCHIRHQPHCIPLSPISHLKNGFTLKERWQDSGFTSQDQEKSQSHSFILLSTAKHTPESARLAASTRAWKSDCWCLCSLYPSSCESRYCLIISSRWDTPGCSYRHTRHRENSEFPAPDCSQ